MSLLVEDRALLAQFRAGSSQALRRVLGHYAPTLAATLRRGFGFRAGKQHVRFAGYRDTFALEDAMQNIFRRAFSDNARTRYDGLRPFAAYLHVIARNVVINEFQTKSRTLELFGIEPVGDGVPMSEEYSAADDPLGEEGLSARGLPEQDLVSAELRVLVREFRAGLTGRDAEVFRLRFDEGLSHTEIASRTHWSPSQIKTTEAHIRTELVRHLHRHGYLTEHRLRSKGARPARTRAQGEKS